MNTNIVGTHIPIDDNVINKEANIDLRVQTLMNEIDERIEEFIKLTGGANGKGAKHVKPRWRAIKKRAGVK